MLKHKKFLSLLLVLPVFATFSCAKAKEEYKVHSYSKEEEKISEHLTVTGELAKKEYDSKKSEVLDLDGLVITIDGQVATNRISERKEVKDLLVSGSYFVCSRDDLPTNTFIGGDYKANTNIESMDFTFYVATAVQVEQTYEIYVSQPFKVTIKNSDAIKPWVWYVVTGVVIFGVIGMVMLTRHYKAKKEGK